MHGDIEGPREWFPLDHPAMKMLTLALQGHNNMKMKNLHMLDQEIVFKMQNISLPKISNCHLKVKNLMYQ